MYNIYVARIQRNKTVDIHFFILISIHYYLNYYDSKEYNKNSISISSDYTYIIIIHFSLSVHDHVCGGLPDFGIHLASDFASFSHTQISLALNICIML